MGPQSYTFVTVYNDSDHCTIQFKMFLLSDLFQKDVRTQVLTSFSTYELSDIQNETRNFETKHNNSKHLLERMRVYNIKTTAYVRWKRLI